VHTRAMYLYSRAMQFSNSLRGVLLHKYDDTSDYIIARRDEEGEGKR